MAEPNPDAYVKSARHAAELAIVCVIVAVVVLLIDNSIKRAILKARDQALTALADLGTLTGQVMNGRQEAAVADGAGGAADPGGEPGVGVGGAAAGSEDVVQVAVPRVDGPAARRAGGAGGPRGDAG